LPLPRPSRMLKWMRRLLRNDQLVLGLLAVAVGAAAGGGVVLFREAIGLVQLAFWGTQGERLWRVAEALPWWWRLLAPAAGGLLIGVVLRLIWRGERVPGVAQVIEATALQGARMPLRKGLLAAAVSAVSIGAGASVGREGPAVHLGATLAARIAAALRLSRPLSRTVLGCGAAAAVAASFNAPIAGALFAHEVVVGHYALSAFAPVVVASVTGTMVSRAHFGDFPAFIIPELGTPSALEFPLFAALGAIGGLTAIAMMRGIVLAEERFARLPGPAFLRPALAGLTVGAIAVPFPQVLGVGYEITDDALRGLVPLWLLCALVVAKLAATAVSLGGGFAGGVFSPSLTVGALVGGAVGTAASWVAPALSSGAADYALIGMGAVAAAVLGAPISTTLIVFELTGNYALTMAVMLAVVVATVVTQQFHGRPSFFHWQLERRGLDLRSGHELDLLRGLRVHLVMKSAQTVRLATGLAEVRALLQRTPYGELFVIDDDGRLHGTITLADLSEAAFDPGLDDLVNAVDVARRNPPLAALNDDLHATLETMVATGEEHLAVVADRDSRRLLGCVHQTDVLAAHNRAIIDWRAEERGERRRR